MCTWQWLSHHPLSCSGSRSGAIHHHDVRVPDHHVGSLIEHTQEVCGLTWSPDGRHLASGGNDNVVNVWDTTLALEGVSPVQTFTHHLAAVKVHVFSSIYFLLACTFWFLSLAQRWWIYLEGNIHHVIDVLSTNFYLCLRKFTN